MNHHRMSSRTPGHDPLLVPPTTDSRVDRADHTPRPAQRAAATRRSGSGSSRRLHPARGARVIALTASVFATGAVAAALAVSEGAWGADAAVTATGSDDLLTDAAGSADSSVATTSTVADDTAASTTPSSTAAATTTPETTQPAEVAAASSSDADGVYLGTAEYTEWGDVQVEVTISDGGIVDVAAVQYPTGRKSSAINEQAIPMLEADAIALQSADLDIVSGATYTSQSYADSLQAALDEAALVIGQETALS